MRRLRIMLLCGIALFLLLAVPGHADFGDYSGDSDWGSWDDYDYDYDYDYDDDYDYDYDDDDGDYDSDGGDATFGELLLTVGVLGGVVYGAVRLGGKQTPTKDNGKPVTKPPMLPISAYSAYDPGFDEEAFKQKLADLWLRMQAAWTAKNIEPLRADLSAPYFAQAQRQLDAHIAAHHTNRVEEPTVLSVVLKGFRRENGTDVISAEIRTKFIDYTTDDETGNVISGDENAMKYMRYEWELIRSADRKSAADRKTDAVSGDGLSTVTCPNCGAEVKINESAKCEACGTFITLGTHDFVLNKVSTVAQVTMRRKKAPKQ